MHVVQPTSQHAMSDPAAPQPCTDELIARHESMLARGDPGDDPVRAFSFRCPRVRALSSLAVSAVVLPRTRVVALHYMQKSTLGGLLEASVDYCMTVMHSATCGGGGAPSSGFCMRSGVLRAVHWPSLIDRRPGRAVRALLSRTCVRSGAVGALPGLSVVAAGGAPLAHGGRPAERGYSSEEGPSEGAVSAASGSCRRTRISGTRFSKPLSW